MADGSGGASLGQGLSIAGTIAQVFGDLYSGAAASNLANYQAGVARVNALLAKQDAIYAKNIGEVEAQQSGMRTRALVGATRVGYGAGNISTATGSPARVLTSETAIGQANEATIRANAAKRAYGFNVAAAQDVAQAGMFDVAAQTAKTTSYFNVASTIIGGAGQVATQYSKAQQSGIYS